MTEIMCVNHPEWPATDQAGVDDGPPLCEDCSRWYELPGERGEFDSPFGDGLDRS